MNYNVIKMDARAKIRSRLAGIIRLNESGGTRLLKHYEDDSDKIDWSTADADSIYDKYTNATKKIYENVITNGPTKLLFGKESKAGFFFFSEETCDGETYYCYFDVTNDESGGTAHFKIHVTKGSYVPHMALANTDSI